MATSRKKVDYALSLWAATKWAGKVLPHTQAKCFTRILMFITFVNYFGMYISRACPIVRSGNEEISVEWLLMG